MGNKYKPQKVDQILQEMKQSSGLLQLLATHRMMIEVWKEIPDPTLRELDLSVSLDTDGTLTILCPSSVALTYVRNRQDLIEHYLEGKLGDYTIRQVRISLSRR